MKYSKQSTEKGYCIYIHFQKKKQHTHRKQIYKHPKI